MFSGGLALFYGVVEVGRNWLGPFTPHVEISRKLSALPVYAGYSLLRIALAYVLSLLFARHLWIHRGLPSARRTLHDSAARRSAIHSGVEFSSGRDAGNGGAFSGTSTGRRVGRGPAHFYRAGVEHGLQLLCVAEEHSARDAGGGHDLPLQLVAALSSDRTAVRARSAWCGIR